MVVHTARQTRGYYSLHAQAYRNNCISSFKFANIVNIPTLLFIHYFPGKHSIAKNTSPRIVCAKNLSVKEVIVFQDFAF